MTTYRLGGWGQPVHAFRLVCRSFQIFSAVANRVMTSNCHCTSMYGEWVERSHLPLMANDLYISCRVKNDWSCEDTLTGSTKC